MMTANQNELSPLDKVRMVEAEVTRRLVAARESAEQTVVKASTVAAQRKSEAREAGTHEGEVLFKSIVAKAEEESQAIIAQAHQRATEVRRRGNQRMEKAISIAMQIVVGLEGEGKCDEH
jgi:vacuolar-type H+-ATPase subunit H